MKDSVIDNLIEIGLSENEATVYFAMLQTGPITILKIANKTGIKRPTVYNIIQSLEAKGLVSLETKGSRKYYLPESPERLEQILVAKRSLLKGIMPTLATKYFQVKKSDNIIKQYIGIENIKNMYLEMLDIIEEGSDYYVLTDQFKWINLEPEFFGYYVSVRREKKVKARYLVNHSDYAKKFQKEIQFDEVKILPESFKLETDLIIIPNQRVIIMQIVPPYLAFNIENKAITNMNQSMFEMMWNSLPKI